jgi:hypothetical protein
MNPLKLALAALCFSQPLVSSNAAEPDFQVRMIPLADRVRVEIGGQLFTEYIYGDGASRSYCYPILASDGTPMTRNFPMEKVAGEDTDHPWHRSLWFAHSIVNGIDFWNEGSGDTGHSPSTKGRTVAAKTTVTQTKDGLTGMILTSDRWVAPDGTLVCTDSRIIRFHASAEARMIDFNISLHAQPATPLVMGDNKDGTMAIRLAQWMSMPHKSQGGGAKVTGGSTNVASATTSAGHLVSSTGLRDNAVWGKRADWCDYYSEHNGKTYGVALFDHPQNPRHPTWWHARDYGLFAANPFGQHDFENLKDQPHIGDFTIPAGGSLTLRYRFYFHNGNETDAKIAEHYAEYAAEK